MLSIGACRPKSRAVVGAVEAAFEVRSPERLLAAAWNQLHRADMRQKAPAREANRPCSRFGGPPRAFPLGTPHALRAGMGDKSWPEDWIQAIERNKRKIEARRQFAAWMNHWLTTDSDCAHDFRRVHGRLPRDVVELESDLARRYGDDEAGRMIDRSLGRDEEDD